MIFLVVVFAPLIHWARASILGYFFIALILTIGVQKSTQPKISPEKVKWKYAQVSVKSRAIKNRLFWLQGMKHFMVRFYFCQKPPGLGTGKVNFFAGLVSGILILLIPALAWAESPSEQYVVERQPVQDLKSLFAVVRTVDVTAARARIGGTLIELLADEGDLVEAGQKLARVRDPKQRLQIAATASKLRSLDAHHCLI